MEYFPGDKVKISKKYWDQLKPHVSEFLEHASPNKVFTISEKIGEGHPDFYFYTFKETLDFTIYRFREYWLEPYSKEIFNQIETRFEILDIR